MVSQSDIVCRSIAASCKSVDLREAQWQGLSPILFDEFLFKGAYLSAPLKNPTQIGPPLRTTDS